MSQQLDQLSNEELGAQAATEVMGWHQENRSVGLGTLKGKTPWWVDAEGKVQQLVVRLYYRGGFAPTAEGNEHQAQLVENKMLELGWGCDVCGPVPGEADPFYTVTFWWGLSKTKDEDREETASAFPKGRAIIIAALKAKGAGSESQT